MDSLRGAFFSRTIWAQGAMSALAGVLWLQDHSYMIPVSWLPVIGAVGILLRVVTGKPLSDRAD